MNVVLGPDLEAAVRTHISGGRYSSAEAVIEDALKALAEREKSNETARRSINEKIDRGIAQLDSGQSVDGDEFFQRLLSREPG